MSDRRKVDSERRCQRCCTVNPGAALYCRWCGMKLRRAAPAWGVTLMGIVTLICLFVLLVVLAAIGP